MALKRGRRSCNKTIPHRNENIENINNSVIQFTDVLKLMNLGILSR